MGPFTTLAGESQMQQAPSRRRVLYNCYELQCMIYQKLNFLLFAPITHPALLFSLILHSCCFLFPFLSFPELSHFIYSAFIVFSGKWLAVFIQPFFFPLRRSISFSLPLFPVPTNLLLDLLHYSLLLSHSWTLFLKGPSLGATLCCWSFGCVGMVTWCFVCIHTEWLFFFISTFV